MTSKTPIIEALEKEQMNKEIDLLSSEQRQLHDAAATKIQAMVRGKHGKNVVKAIRRSLQREEEANNTKAEDKKESASK